MTCPVICDQGYDPNWIWIWIYPVWDLMIYPILSRGDATWLVKTAFPNHKVLIVQFLRKIAVETFSSMSHRTTTNA